ncbi:MAG: hypothetical protein LUC98_04070 [Lachnospiraceae bacterium]|nr:hypothetical protein [Lachnospiraceae bacterium]
MVEFLILLVGLIIYAGYGLAGLVWLLAAALLIWLAGLALPRYRWLFWPLIVISAAPLILMRLQPVTGFGLLAPLGVSYFTLQMTSYLADVRKEKYPPEKNFLTFALYLTYFPHLVQGPIESFDHMKTALAERKFSWDGVSAGAIRMVWGAFKMLVISARASVVVSTISASPEEYRGAYALFAMILYSIRLYADFSGCMDIVLGVSQVLGLRLSENFDAPYYSQTVAEFWRRWHITLGAWLRNYIYIPLGGNRKGKLRKVINLLVTFLVSGFWHGFHYILWGLFNGIFVALGNGLRTKFKAFNRVLTFLIISVLWSFFIWPDTFTALGSIASLFTTFNYGALAANILALGLGVSDWIVFVGATVLLWVYDGNKERFRNVFTGSAPAARLAVVGALGLLALVFGMYGIGFEAEQFIYSSF